MKTEQQQKLNIRWLNMAWRAVGIAWVVWVVIGQVSDMFFLNPSYYWIHEMMFWWWSDAVYILLAVTVIVSILAGGLTLFYRKKEVPESKKTHQELPKMKEGETVLDYFNRTRSNKSKDK